MGQAGFAQILDPNAGTAVAAEWIDRSRRSYGDTLESFATPVRLP
jgi:hypothetical protein